MAENNKAGEATSLKQLFQGMTPVGTEVVQGVVTSASPLKIQVVNNEKLILSSNILIVPKHLTDYTATVDISLGKGSVTSSTKTGQGKHEHPNGGISDTEGEHLHTLSTFSLKGVSVTVYNALKAGEKVHILSFNNGKKYYVLDRVV